MIAKKVFSSPLKGLVASRPSILAAHFSSAAASPSHDFWNARAAVWWDLESRPMGTGSHPEHLNRYTETIPVALSERGHTGHIQVSCFADVFKLPSWAWQDVFEYTACITHLPDGGKHTAYSALLASMMSWVSLIPPPAILFLISNDRRFAPALLELSKRNYHVLVATDEVPGVLCTHATMVWRWDDFKLHLVKDESPIKPPKSHARTYRTLEDSDVEPELPRKFIRQLGTTKDPSPTEVAEIVSEVEKYNSLVQLVKQVTDDDSSSSILIFTSTMTGCDQIETLRRDLGRPVLAIHEGQNEAERDRVLSEFKSGECPVMIATDLAARTLARKLDVEDVKYVINYDCPISLEDYIHSREHAANNATAHTFLTVADLADEECLINFDFMFPYLYDFATSFEGVSVKRLPL